VSDFVPGDFKPEEAAMRQRFVTIAAAGIAIMVAGTLSAQTAPKPAQAPGKAAYTAPKTGDGQPDLQGVWDFRTVTPMERPAEFKDKAFLTAQEAAEYEKKINTQRNVDENRDKTVRRQVNGTDETQDVASAYNQFWWDRGTQVIGTFRTSLVVDPADGKLPELTDQAKKRRDERAVIGERPAWGPEDRSVGERCILGFNAGPPINPGGYNQNLQIVQSKDNVVLLNEMVHTARIVPLDNRSHLSFPQWTGSSIGHWEGNTLVVETTGFYQTTSFQNSSPNMKVVERFTRVGPKELQYQYTVTDPTTWTRPFTVEVPMLLSTLPIYEYACHEGNYGMFGLLSGARAVEKDLDKAKRGSN
jgi:hypothetical protein